MAREPAAHPRPLSDRRLAKLGKKPVDGISGHRPRERAPDPAGLDPHVSRDQEKDADARHEGGMDPRLQVHAGPRLSDGERHRSRQNPVAALVITSAVGRHAPEAVVIRTRPGVDHRRNVEADLEVADRPGSHTLSSIASGPHMTNLWPRSADRPAEYRCASGT